MILLFLIIFIIIFSIISIFIVSPAWRYILAIIFLILVIVCETFMILNDRINFGMNNKLRTSNVSILSLQDDNTLYFEEKNDTKIYYFLQKQIVKLVMI